MDKNDIEVNAEEFKKTKHDTPKEENTQQTKQLSSPTISYQDLIVSSIGKIGRWQFFAIFAILVPKMFFAWSVIAVTFSLGKTDWWKVTTLVDPISNSVFFLHF